MKSFAFLTYDSSISLKDFLDINFVDLKSIKVAHEDPGVDSVRILRACLVAYFAYIHGVAAVTCFKSAFLLLGCLSTSQFSK